MQAVQEIRNRLSSLRIRHLLLLDAIVEHGTLRKAAQALHLTQPAASLMVRDLEAAIGASLFVRSRRGMIATARAAAFLERTRAMLGELRLAAAEAADPESGTSVTLNIGVLPRVMHWLMPRVLRETSARWPELRLRLTEGVAGQLLPALSRGELDCAIARLTHESMGSDFSERVAHTTLYEDGMRLVASPTHPLKIRRRVSLKELSRAAWLLPPPGTETREVFINTFLAGGVSPPPARVESLSVTSNAELARNTDLLTILPESLAQTMRGSGEMLILPVQVDTSLSPIAFFSRRSSEGSEAIRRFRDLVINESRLLPPTGRARGKKAERRQMRGRPS